MLDPAPDENSGKNAQGATSSVKDGSDSRSFVVVALDGDGFSWRDGRRGFGCCRGFGGFFGRRSIVCLGRSWIRSRSGFVCWRFRWDHDWRGRCGDDFGWWWNDHGCRCWRLLWCGGRRRSRGGFVRSFFRRCGRRFVFLNHRRIGFAGG